MLIAGIAQARLPGLEETYLQSMIEFHMAPTNLGPGADALHIIYVVLRVDHYEFALGLSFDSLSELLSELPRL